MTAPTRSAIPTTYRGTNFRSRLEARWAAFFDLVNWRWTYEPFDAGGWIPDFLIEGRSPFLVEVGPVVALAEYREKATKAEAAFPRDVWTCNREWDHGPDGECIHESFGTKRERATLVLGVSPWDEKDAPGYLTDCGYGHEHGNSRPGWVVCRQCKNLAVFTTCAHEPIRPCGHEFGALLGYQLTYDHVRTAFAKAGNHTQWKRPESVGEILSRPWR